MSQLQLLEQKGSTLKCWTNISRYNLVYNMEISAEKTQISQTFKRKNTYPVKYMS